MQVSGVEYDRAGVAAHAKNLATKVKGGLEVRGKPAETRGCVVPAYARPTVRAALRLLPKTKCPSRGPPNSVHSEHKSDADAVFRTPYGWRQYRVIVAPLLL